MRRGGPASTLFFQITIGGRNERSSRPIVDKLNREMFRGTEHREPRALSCSAHARTYTAVASCPKCMRVRFCHTRFLFLFRQRRRFLSRLAPDDFSLAPNSFSFIRLGFAERPNRSRNIPHLLFVKTGYRNHVFLHREANSFGCRNTNGVRETKCEDQGIALQRDTITNPLQDEAHRES